MMLEQTVFRPKVILLGDGGVGKSKFISRINSDGLVVQKHKRLGVTVYKFPIFTSIGTIEYEVWDTYGQERFGLLRDAYYLYANAVILFIDLTKKESYYHLAQWIRFAVEMCRDVPIILAGNKVDDKNRVIPVEKILFPLRHEYPYIEISAKTNYNINKLFEILTNKIMNVPNLQITEPVKLVEPEVPVDQNHMDECERALALAIKNSTIVPISAQNQNRNMAGQFGMFVDKSTDQFEFEEDLIRDLN